MLNEYEEKEQTIMMIFQILFKNFGAHNIQLNKLTDLLNEYDLFLMLQEIEPDILMVTNMEDFALLKSDQMKGAIEAGKRSSGRKKTVKFGGVNDKFTNFIAILQMLHKFFENTPTGQMLRKDFNVNHHIKVNDLVKPLAEPKNQLNDSTASQSNYNHSLLKLGEILLVLSALSSKRDDYINILNSLDEPEMKYLYDYMSIIDNYINFGMEKEDIQNITRSNTMAGTRVFRKGITIKQNVVQKEQLNYCKNIESMDKEISHLKTKNEELTNEMLDLGFKYRDILRDNELLKSSANQNNQIEEDAYYNSVLITQLKNDLFKKDIELDDYRRDNELIQKRNKTEVDRLGTIIENLEQKCDEMKSVKFDNEKLKLKIKEMNINKDKIVAYDYLEQSLEAKNKQIENLMKEKQMMFAQSEKLVKENNEVREQLKESAFQKKKLEFDLGDMKKEITHINKRVSKRQTLKHLYKDFSTDGGADELEKLKTHYKEMITSAGTKEEAAITTTKPDNALSEIIEDTKEDCFNLNLALGLEEELDNLRNDLQKANREIKKQLEDIKRYTEEISELKTDKESLRVEVRKLHSEFDKQSIEKEKLEITKQKFDLDIQKYDLIQEKLEADKNNLVDTVNELREKLEQIENEKDNILDEIESLKLTLKTKTRQYDRLVEENNTLLVELENMPKGQGRSAMKEENLNESQGNIEQTKNSNVDPAYVNKLKAEIHSKNEQIKQLNEKVRNHEKIEEIIKMKDQKTESDYKFYKMSYEEQKSLVNSEHEVLSNKLCDLAMQFVTFKNELLKNVKPSIINQHNTMFNYANN